jgi:hypothetical protein
MGWTEEKTSSVHFMRFELSNEMISVLRWGAALEFGSEHDGYPYQADVSAETGESLLNDLV